MKTREQNRNNEQTEIERFDWFVERIQTLVAFGWLSECSGEKTSYPGELSGNQSILRFDVILKYDWPMEQCLLHTNKGKRRVYVLIFDKTNNEHLPKPFFEVIRKSLYPSKVSNKTMH